MNSTTCLRRGTLLSLGTPCGPFITITLPPPTTNNHDLPFYASFSAQLPIPCVFLDNMFSFKKLSLNLKPS